MQDKVSTFANHTCERTKERGDNWFLSQITPKVHPYSIWTPDEHGLTEVNFVPQIPN